MADQKYLIYTNTDNNDSTIGKFFKRNETMLEGLSLIEFLKYDGETGKSNIDRISESYTRWQLFNHESVVLTIKQSNNTYLKTFSSKLINDLPFNLNTKVLLPKDKFKSELTFIKGKNLEIEQRDNVFYFAEKLLQLLNDPGYLPSENLIRQGRDFSVELISENCQVFLWSRSLGRIIDVSNFIQNLSTSKSEVGTFNLSLSPLHNLEDLSFINNQDILNYFVLNQSGKNNIDFFYKNIQYNDIVFIRFEKLQLENGSENSYRQKFEVNQSELPGKIWDMIGLVDSVSQSSSYNNTDYTLSVSGRDFYKLLIEDGSYFMSLRYLNNGQSIFVFNENDKWFKRNFGDKNGNSGTFEYYEFPNSLRKISDSVGFIINQLTNIEILPSDQNIFSNYKIKAKKYKLSEDNSIETDTSGVWQIIHFLFDESLEDRRVMDTSISYVDSTILEQFNKLCQKPFVEFFGDTYGDEYNFIVRKPPFTKDQIISFLNPKKSLSFKHKLEGNYQIIELDEKDIEGYNNLEWDDTFYSWYQIQPKDNMLGQYSELMSGGMIGIVYFDELCQYYGNKRLIVPDNYLSLNGMSHVENDKDLNNYRSYLLNDLKYLIDSNSYLPFTRRGTLVLPKGDRRIKRGTFIRVNPTKEIFYVDSVSHSLSFSNRRVDRSTTLQVSRGMIENYIYGDIGFEDDGRIIGGGEGNISDGKFLSDPLRAKKFSYFDIIKTKVITKASEYEYTEEIEETVKESLSEYSVKIPLTSGIAYRNNNPGNLMFKNQPDAVIGEQRFKTINGEKIPVLNSKGQPTYWAKFESPEKGFENVIRQVKIETSKRNLDLEQLVYKYSPPTENRTEEILTSWIRGLNKPPLNSISRETKLTDIDSFELAKLIVRGESSTKVEKRDSVKVENTENIVEGKKKKIVYDKKFVHKLNKDQLDFFMKRKQFNILNYGK